MNDDEDIVAQFREVAATQAEVAESFRRLTPAAYGDGENTPTPSNADVEEVAFQVFSQGDQSIENEFDLSALWIFWGQFLDHDLDLAPEQEGEEAELLKVEPPFNVVRSEVLEGTGENGIPREQFNSITPLIDASNVYGSDLARQDALRSGEGGRLKAQPGPVTIDLLPDARDVFGPDHTETEGFTAGDIRAPENSALAAVQSVFLNEHNYWADRFAVANPDWTDEEIFQNARAVIETLLQKITYEEFLPILVGDALPAYAGYDPTADPQVSTEFATAAFRFGHTSIPDRFTFVDEDGGENTAPVALFETFENDAILEERGPEALLRGVLEERSQKIDAKVVDGLNFFLFTPDGGLTGFSLPERNMLRGQDHGIGSYLEVRSAVLGEAFPALQSTDFSIITSDPELQAALAGVYPTVGDVDLWVGGLAEDHVPGTTLGPTFQAIVAEQFAATRDGDPLFYLNREWIDELLFEELMATRFSDVLMRSGGIDHVQGEALLASERMGGDAGKDNLKGSDARELMIGFEGRDVLRGKGGEDDLFGDEGADRLYGGSGNDALNGGTGGDKLSGGGGDDTLSGGDGRDVLKGGPGADRFVFNEGEIGADTVKDFEVGSDLLVIEGYAASFADIEIRTTEFMNEVFIEGIQIAYLWAMGGATLGEEDFVFVA